MAPAEDADITPFEMSCAGGAPPLALQLSWGGAWTISSTSSKVTPKQGVTLQIEPSPQPMLVAFRRQVLRPPVHPILVALTDGRDLRQGWIARRSAVDL
jgi:hypothetical protein